MKHFDVVIIGAGAAGMMCAVEAGRRGRPVLVVEHNRKPGEKIRISGGGRCNFTNLNTGREHFLSANPRFMLSALAGFGPRDMVARLEGAGIGWCPKKQGQLFCTGSAQQVVDMFVADMGQAGVVLRLGEDVGEIRREGQRFSVRLKGGDVICRSLVVACGGKSIPRMGASGLGYRIAAQFGLDVVPTRPALVPLVFEPGLLARTAPLSGIGLEVRAEAGRQAFTDHMLLTHRGLSGPAILQISSYWQPGADIRLDLAPGHDSFELLKRARRENGRQEIGVFLSGILPRRVVQLVLDDVAGRLADLGNGVLLQVARRIGDWHVRPVASEGYRTAEVTLGGVDTRALDGKTLQSRSVPGLYFIGEVVDVTGWLGGYNFQWAWSSGFAAGQSV